VPTRRRGPPDSPSNAIFPEAQSASYGERRTVPAVAFVRQLWLDVRGAVFVIAQVITLGVVAMVLGLLALNAVLTQPLTAHPTPQSQPARPLTALVPTLLASTPSPRATEPPSDGTPMASAPLYQPPGLDGSTATAKPESPPTPTPVAIPTAVPKPAPAPAVAQPTPPRPAPTGTPRPTATTGPTGQLLKILPTGDGLPARVRTEPTTRAPILVRVPLGAIVEVIGQANGDEVQPGNRRWLRIRWKETTGWIYSSLIGE